VAEKGSFISRFFYKLLEIMGAAVATAVSGYLVAHLGGFLPSQPQAPTAPAVVVAPSEHHPAPKAVPANAPATQPATTPQPTQSAAAPPASPDHRAAQSQSDTSGSAQTARKAANTKAAAAPPRKSGKETAVTDANRSRETPDAKARENAEAKARETTEAKPREAEDKESVEAQIRAALANVDASHPAPTEASSRRGENHGSSAQPRPGEASPNTTAVIPARPLDPPPASVGPGVQPRSADLSSPTQQPAVQPAAIQPQTAPAQPTPLQVAPVQPTPQQQPDALTTVEIKSRPVATIDTAPAPEAAPPPQEERGVLSVFKRILPDLRRPASSDEAPRPPASVGE
jgi:hypothetical protein